jgi:ABC-2 type transport system permease protein
VAVSLPVVFGFFIVALLDSLFGQQVVRFMTPFRYFDTGYIIAHGSYEWPYVALELVIVIVAIVGGYLIFARKDVGSA